MIRRLDDALEDLGKGRWTRCGELVLEAKSHIGAEEEEEEEKFAARVHLSKLVSTINNNLIQVIVGRTI